MYVVQDNGEFDGDVYENGILIVITDGEKTIHPKFQRLISKSESLLSRYNTIDKFRATKIPSYILSDDMKLVLLSCKKRRYNQYKYSDIKDGLERLGSEVISKMIGITKVYIFSTPVMDDKLVLEDYKKAIKKAFRSAKNLKSDVVEVILII